MSSYDLNFGFQDCADFINSFENDDTSSNSLYTPSPHDILNSAPFMDDNDEFSNNPYEDDSATNVVAESFNSPSKDLLASEYANSGYDNWAAASAPGQLSSIKQEVFTPPEEQGLGSSSDMLQSGMKFADRRNMYPSPSGSSVSSHSSVSGPSANLKKPTTNNHPSTTTTNNIKNGRVGKPRKEKSSHNVIEKRYRTNINDKILALRDCVPALRCVVSGEPVSSENLDGLTPANKLNKATVLTKATEYIVHLQSKNNSLQKEVEELRAMLNAGVGAGGNLSPGINNITNNNNNSDVVGLDSNPDSAISDPFFGSSSSSGLSSYHSSPVDGFEAYPDSPNRKSSVASKIMMCSMAGMMASGMMGDENGAQGLSAIPLFSGLSKFQVGPLGFPELVFALKVALIVGTLVYVLAPVFSSKPNSRGGKPAVTTAGVQTSRIMSVTELRKQTWLAASRDLYSHSVLGDTVDTVVVFLQVLIRFISGFESLKAFKKLFSRSSSFLVDTETLNRALDSQLCGGDVDCSYWALFNSFLHGFLTPPDATRYMLQSLQAQILAQFGPNLTKPTFTVTARRLWQLASKQPGCADLPENLKAFLNADIKSDCSMYIDAVTRLRNIAFGLPCSYQCLKTTNDSIYESLPHDPASVSSLDLFASFYSAKLVDSVVYQDISSGEVDVSKLQLAKSIVPRNSRMEQRVCIVFAMLLGSKTPMYVEEAMDTLKKALEHTKAEAAANHEKQEKREDRVGFKHEENDDDEAYDDDLDDSFYQSDGTDESDDTVSTIEPTRNNSNSNSSSAFYNKLTLDGKIALYSSFVRLYLARGEVEHAVDIAQKLRLDPTSTKIGILGFDSLMKMLNELKDHEVSPKTVIKNPSQVESLAAVTRLWIGSEEADRAGLDLKRRRALVGDCVQISMHFGGFEVDEGYSSQ